MLLQSSLGESIVSAMFMCIVLLALSSPLIYAGWKNRDRYYELSSVNTDFKESAINKPVFVSGKIDNVSKKIESPFRSKKCSLAMWDISVLKRIGKLDTGIVWSQYCMGIIGDNITINTGDQDVKIRGLNTTKILDSKEKIKRSLMADSASKFSSVEIELDSQSFENKVRPKEETPKEYQSFTDNIRFNRPRRDSYNLIGKILCKLRTPRDTTRYREKIFNNGDKVSIIGMKLEDGIKFKKCEDISPLLISKTRNQILRKYRIAYVFQLYIVPIFCILFSTLMGYAAYL